MRKRKTTYPVARTSRRPAGPLARLNNRSLDRRFNRPVRGQGRDGFDRQPCAYRRRRPVQR